MKLKFKIIIVTFLIFLNFWFIDSLNSYKNTKSDKKIESSIEIINKIKKILDINNKELLGILKLDKKFRKEKLNYYLKRKKERIRKKLSKDILKKIYSRVERAKPHPNIYTKFEKDRFRLAWSSETDLSYWLQVLDKRDLSGDKYIVLPAEWLVIPVNSVGESDKNYHGFINWREVDVSPYLETWVLEIPWTSANWFWEVWNKVIVGHSSYWLDKPGRYKTDFQSIIATDIWDEVWVYEKNKDWVFKRYVYKIKKSYNTSFSDISVLKPSEKKLLTLFTCTPIWWIKGRWIVRAEFEKMD